jgi:hypothetical protein
MNNEPVGRDGANIANLMPINKATAASIFSLEFRLSGIILPCALLVVIMFRAHHRKMLSVFSGVNLFSRIAAVSSCIGS